MAPSGVRFWPSICFRSSPPRSSARLRIKRVVARWLACNSPTNSADALVLDHAGAKSAAVREGSETLAYDTYPALPADP
jgi:hypothetical protein